MCTLNNGFFVGIVVKNNVLHYTLKEVMFENVSDFLQQFSVVLLQVHRYTSS